MDMDRGLLRAIFSDASELHTDEWIELRVLTKRGPDGKRARVSQSVNFFKDPDALLQAVQGIGQEYLCAYGVCPRNNKGMRKKDVSRALALWVDLDAKDLGSKTAAEKATRMTILPTSYVVDSGYGYHAYWLLEGDCTPDEAEEVNKALLAASGGGAGTADATRILRVPGSWNLKGEKPIPCRVTRARPDIRYSLKDISAALKIAPPIRRMILEAAVARGKSRSERDYAVIRALHAAKMSEAAMRIIYKEQPVGDKASEANGDQYLDRTIDAVANTSRTGAAVIQHFTEEENGYYVDGIGGKGRHRVSTFVFEPRRLIQEDKEDVLWGTMRAGGLVWDGIALPKSAFTSVHTLLRRLGRMDWQWLGSDREVRHLLPFLVEKWALLGEDRAEATSVLGRHGDLWVTEDMVLSATAELDPREAPVVFLDPGRTLPMMEYPEADVQSTLEKVAVLLPQINVAQAIWPIIGWFLAAPLKPVFAEFKVRFPHLDLYGTKGSGKSSTVLEVFLRMLGYAKSSSWDCNTTPFVLLSLMSSTTSIPVSLSEFRRTTLSERAFASLRRALLLAYDSGKDSRGRADQTTQEYILSAPLVLDGEDVVSDPAIRERTLIVNLSPHTVAISSGAWKAFKELVALPLTWFARPYIQYTLGYDADKLAKLWKECLSEIEKLFPDILADRVRRNLIVALCGIRLYERFLVSKGIAVEPVGASVLKATREAAESSDLGRGSTMSDVFIEELLNAVVLSPSGKPFLWIYDTVNNVLWFQLSTALSWWHKDRRRRGQSTLQTAAMKAQLAERSLAVIGPGQYIDGPKAFTVHKVRRRLYGVDVEACYNAGLDVPSALEVKSVITPISQAVTLGKEVKDGKTTAG